MRACFGLALVPAVVMRVLLSTSLVAFFVGIVVIAPGEAEALVPRVERVIDAVASANRSGRRVSALRFKLNLHIGEGPPVAIGELVTHPTGLARLELRANGGLVERHILLGNQHSAARNARVLVRPREFLPPLFVLQSNSGAVLEAALSTLGIDGDIVGLAPCGKYDCFVIGDPERAVTRLGMPPVAKPAVDESDPQPERAPSLWVDTDDFNVRQIESMSGAKIVLGPYVSFERLSVPQWWSIEEAGKRIVRFEVDSVVEVNAPAAAFSKAWLMTPDHETVPGAPGAEERLPSTNTSTSTSTKREIPVSEVVPTLPAVSSPGPGYREHPDNDLAPEAGEWLADPSPDGAFGQ